jgi:transposase InsO family protein
MAKSPKSRRSHRRFDDDFKAQAARLVPDEDLTCSMSRRGDCYDNAVMEAFFVGQK